MRRRRRGYAGKAFLSADVARLVATEGLRGSLLGERPRSAPGMDPDRIGLHGSSDLRTAEEIRLLEAICILNRAGGRVADQGVAAISASCAVMVRHKSGIP